MLLSAKDARRFVKNSIAKKAEDELKKIEEAINKAIEADECCCRINYNISNYAKGELEKLGYDVIICDDECQKTTFIAW